MGNCAATADEKEEVKVIKGTYLEYGGSFACDGKDTDSFKYVNFDKLPAFTANHKSLMAKVLTPVHTLKFKPV